MRTSKMFNRKTLSTVALAATLLALPSGAIAGTGASYASLKNAINSNNPDSIIGEVERAEKLPCGSCIDLVKPLIDHEDARIRDVAAWWLNKRVIRQQVRDEMFDRLQGGDQVAARNAAEVLGRFMHPEAYNHLEMAIHNAALGDEARAAAATAVGSIGSRSAKGILEGALTSDSAAVRKAAAKALRNVANNLDGVALLDLLQDSDPGVVREAALTVGAVREEGAVNNLILVLQDESLDAYTRRDAAWALGKIGDGSARDALAEASDADPSMLVRGAARAAYNDLR